MVNKLNRSDVVSSPRVLLSAQLSLALLVVHRITELQLSKTLHVLFVSLITQMNKDLDRIVCLYY